MGVLKNKYFQAFMLSLLVGCAMIIPSIIAGHGILTLRADFNFQQIPFNEFMNDSIKNGNMLWVWNNDLGSDFIGAFSFYNLTSPFTLIGFLFPANWFPYLIGPIFILKYGIAGLTSYLYLQQYVKDKKWALLGSLLYAFSGFQITNMLFYHFHDVVALFPLLLYSLDRLVNGNKKWLFSLCVALSVFTNYFFFIGEVVFLIIYYLIKVISKSYTFSARKFGRIWFEGILGVGIAMVILLPSILFVMDNPRVNNYWTLRSMFVFDKIHLIEILRAMFFPSDDMSLHSVLSADNYSSCEAFLPFVSCIFVFAYIFKKPKDWKSLLFIICLVFMFIPILNSSFFAFTNTYYARWFYMPILIMCLLTASCLDENIKVKLGIIITLILFIIFGLSLAYMYFGVHTRIIYNKMYFIVYLCLFIICFIGTYFCVKNKKYKFILLIIGIIIYIVFRGNYFFYQNKLSFQHLRQKYDTFLSAYSELKIPENNVRVDGSGECFSNLNYVAKIPYLKNFNSNLHGSNFEFYYSVGIPNGSIRDVSTILSEDEKNLHNFLSVKYLISCDTKNSYFDKNYKLISKNNKFYIYKNNEYKKMGISYNYYISTDDFNKLDFKKKRDVLNKAIVLDKKQIKKYGKYFEKYDDGKMEYINTLSNNKFSLKKNKFNSSFKTPKDTLIIYTIPYSKGWNSKVNGKDALIEKVDNGFMAIKVEKGFNNVEFIYTTPGLKIGFIISIISVLILIGSIVLEKIKYKQKTLI